MARSGSWFHAKDQAGHSLFHGWLPCVPWGGVPMTGPAAPLDGIVPAPACRGAFPRCTVPPKNRRSPTHLGQMTGQGRQPTGLYS